MGFKVRFKPEDQSLSVDFDEPRVVATPAKTMTHVNMMRGMPIESLVKIELDNPARLSDEDLLAEGALINQESEEDFTLSGDYSRWLNDA